MSGIDEISDTDIAIVGMAGHFPGAPDVDQLWQRVAAGDDCLTDLSLDDLEAEGVPRSDATASNYVRRSGVLREVEYFDPGFFGIGPRDAAIMDPQHRHFMECAWEALEAAGVVPERFDGAIGVFAGCGMNTYLLNNLLADPDLLRRLGWFLLRHTGNDKDFLATTVSYRLDLRGPSINVQTACSTSLVAVHLAVQSLLAIECDVALAGGVTIEAPHRVGYHYQEGEILSPDGRCRAFDLASAGTVLTSGAGAVVLRRLTDAWDDGDPILAVIKGSAVNNDGARKVSYLAPSVDGHADVVKEALAVAGVGARDLQLVEAHGTGTPVGDPIEVAALTEAFRASTDDTGFCRLVSTKPNIGHLDTAAGVASLIKVVQSMRHQTLPPIANFTGPSPLLDLAATPFLLSGDASEWPGDRVRRAGISSLGVGGTNAHVVVEEAPQRDALPASAPEQVLALSGRDDQAVADAAEKLAAHLEAHPEIDLGDVAFTLATRRRHHSVRRVVAATDRAHAVDQLRRIDRGRSFQQHSSETAPEVAFLFPGGGSQYTSMAAGLDHRFSVFHDVMSDGRRKVRELSGIDLAPFLAADSELDGLDAPTVALPSVFLTSLALARQWMAWGVQPSSYIGHSLGEYVAAHLAGVLSFDDAIQLVVTRAGLMERVGGPGAAMLVVPLDEAAARELLTDNVSLAVVNTAEECVLAGRADDITLIEKQLLDRGEQGTLIPLAAAAHSLLLDPVLDEFRSVVERTTLSAPTTRYMSNLSGTWITAEQATDPGYWVSHLRNTVRYADNLNVALADAPTVTVELGPGQSLSSYARRSAHSPVAAIAALRHPRQQVDDTAYTLNAFASQWAAGVPVQLDTLIGSDRRALTLPTYAFQRQRYWIDPPARSAALLAHAGTSQGVAVAERQGQHDVALVRYEKPSQMWWQPVWEPAASLGDTPPRARRWWVVGTDGDPLHEALCAALTTRGFEIHRAHAPLLADSFDLADHDGVLIVGDELSDPLDVDHAVSTWLGVGLDAVRALGGAATLGHRLAFVSRGAFGLDAAATRPVDALALGAAAVAPHEYPDLDTVLIDIVTGADETVILESTIDALVDELGRGSNRVVALRDGQRLVPVERKFDQADDLDDASSVVPGGTYLVTGGLGAIGHTLAAHLAKVGANLVVVTSSPLPSGDARDEWIRSHGPMEATSQRLRRLAELEAMGGGVEVVVADLARPAGIAAALDHAVATFGRIDGAVHAAGTLCDRLIGLVEPRDIEEVIGVKARGAVTLTSELQQRGASLLVLISSTSTALTPAGQVAYVAANAVLDSLAGAHDHLRVVTLNYGVWSDIGMAERASRRERLGLGDGEPLVHPVFEERTTHDDGAVDVFGHLVAGQWLLDEHRTVDGQAILPGTGHLELLLAASELAGVASAPVTLRSVTIHEVLAVPDDGSVAIRARVANGLGQRVIELESDGGASIGWVLHSSAVVDSEPSPAAPEAPTDQLAMAPADPLAGQRDRLRLGGRWQPEATAAFGEASVRADLSLQAAVPTDAGLWRAHPAIIDAATGLGAQLIRAASPTDDLFVPISYDRVTLFAPVPLSVRVIVTRRDEAEGRTPHIDVQVFDHESRCVMVIDGLQLWPVAADAPLGVRTTDAAATGSIHGLAQLAEGLGIRREEGVALLEQLLASDAPRLIASSVDLDQLRTVDSVATPASVDDTAKAVATGATPLERIGAIWEELLGVSGVGADDNFFDLGGHSLIAIRLMSRLQRELGVRLQLTDIFEAPSLGALAEMVAPLMPATEVVAADGSSAGRPAVDDSERVHRSLVQISSGGNGSPLFIVHGAGGNVLFLWSLARALSGARAVYGFQAAGVDSRDMPDGSIEAMATRYVTELRAAHSGPYLLGGYSGGGLVALEMAKQLRELGDEVTHVFLFDSVPPGCTSPGRRARAANLVANVRRLGARSVRPYVRANLKRWYRTLLGRQGSVTAGNMQQNRELGHEEVEGYVNLFFYFSATAERYQPSRYDVDVTVLKASEVWPVQPYDYYWTPYVTGDLQVRSVPGSHHSMFYQELVPRLAAVVQARLAEIESQSGPPA